MMRLATLLATAACARAAPAAAAAGRPGPGVWAAAFVVTIAVLYLICGR